MPSTDAIFSGSRTVLRLAVVMLQVCAISAVANATIYRCNINGKIIFSDRPCSDLGSSQPFLPRSSEEKLSRDLADTTPPASRYSGQPMAEDSDSDIKIQLIAARERSFSLTREIKNLTKQLREQEEEKKSLERKLKFYGYSAYEEFQKRETARLIERHSYQIENTLSVIHQKERLLVETNERIKSLSERLQEQAH